MTDWLLTASERPMAGPFFQNFRKVRKEKMPMQKIPFVTKEKLDEIISRYPTSFYIYDEKGEGELSLAAIGVCAPAVTAISAFAFMVGIGGSTIMSMKKGKAQL